MFRCPRNRVNSKANWNQKLRALTDAQEDYERQRQANCHVLNEQQRRQIASLATAFPRLWHDPATPQRERKRMIRLLIEDVTVTREEEIVAQVRFRGGTMQTVHVPGPRPVTQLHKIDPAIVVEIDTLVEAHTDREIAGLLNARGLQPGVANRFTPWIIWRLRTKHGLEDRFTRLRRQGWLTRQEIADALQIHPATVQKRHARGELVAVAYNEKPQCLYAPPGPPTMIGCARCGKLIPERGPSGQRQKWCSVSCRTAAYVSRRKAAGWVRVRQPR